VTITHNIFPILVHQVPDFISATELATIKDYLKSRRYNPHGALSGNASSTFASGNNELDIIDQFIPIKDRLIKCCDTYSNSMGIDKVRIANSWANIQRPDSKLEFHSHSFSAISGALYIHLDALSSPISFKNPNPYIDVLERQGGFTQYTATTYTLTPKPGDLLIWAGWLQHGSIRANQSDERIVISFNSTPA